ncbi:hypothetical protein GCM10012275_46050 [Longimycelium tulufanense]|uniref:FMN-dependent dehydrogenase domain-containing protein n=1 Tax=Longimycelium tulufanense TaxID=907463 RepID=A0A8J3CF83_9PSEU|nr:hypothetical protein GCM10012275_46050 [Longimycelium tulufanense]
MRLQPDDARAAPDADSGVRTGADVVKALALGARAVLRGLLADFELTLGLGPATGTPASSHLDALWRR